jgi:hypothetical protein
MNEISSNLLSSLNAGKLVVKTQEEMQQFIENSSILSLRESYSISSFYIENLVKKYQHTNDAERMIRKIFDATILSAKIVGVISKRTIDKPSRFVPFDSSVNMVRNVFRKGERELALKFIKDRLSQLNFETLYICDAYFTEEDIDALQIIQSVNPNCKIIVLSSIYSNNDLVKANKYVECYQKSWNRISIEKPPSTEIILVGKESNGTPPFHDRWWIVNDGENGLRYGTSFNSIGLSKDSEISILNVNESSNIYHTTITDFALTKKREYEGERLVYRAIYL